MMKPWMLIAIFGLLVCGVQSTSSESSDDDTEDFVSSENEEQEQDSDSDQIVLNNAGLRRCDSFCKKNIQKSKICHRGRYVDLDFCQRQWCTAPLCNWAATVASTTPMKVGPLGKPNIPRMQLPKSPLTPQAIAHCRKRCARKSFASGFCPAWMKQFYKSKFEQHLIKFVPSCAEIMCTAAFCEKLYRYLLGRAPGNRVEEAQREYARYFDLTPFEKAKFQNQRMKRYTRRVVDADSSEADAE